MDKYLPDECFSLTEGAKLFLPTIFKMVQNSIYSQNIFEADIWQPQNKKNLNLVLKLVEKLVYENSKIVNPEHLETVDLYLKNGKSCIIMPEHYSNFDLPALFYLIAKYHPNLLELIENTVSLAAAKLNAESKVVLAFSEAFHRIMIYPAREKAAKHEMSVEETTEEKKLSIINQRAIKKMYHIRDEGRAVLMFPSGTRYRPENPESRNALEQAASFLKRFDYVCFIGIAGNTLIVNPNNNMAEDILRRDSMVYWVDEPIPSKEFINNVMGDSFDKKVVAEAITHHLLELHERAEKIRQELIQVSPPEYLGPITSPEGIAHFLKEYNIDSAVLKKFM